MRVSVIGTGYVGLVSGVCLAEKGHKVTCVDVDQAKVDSIGRGVPPIFEVSLEELLRKNIGSNLLASTDLPKAVADSELTILAVGTPFDGQAIDLAYVKAAAAQVGQVLRDKASYHVVVVKSTVVPGTTENVVAGVLEESSGKKAGDGFGVGVNPEFLTEGQAVKDFMFPDRIVLGGIDENTLQTLDRLYDCFDGVPVVRTTCGTAEMIKYSSNCMLATQISFSNELANLCSTLGGIDIAEVMRGLHLSLYLRPTASGGERVQAPISSFLEAGCGFGGSCLPKDVNALIAHGERSGSPMPLLRAVMETNYAQPAQLLKLVNKHFPSLEGVKVAVLGLAFKPDTDDMRESPALPIIQELLAQKATVLAYDPVAMEEAKKILADAPITYCASLIEALQKSEAACLITRWDEFRAVPEILAAMEKPPLLVDGRRMLSKDSVPVYEGIGLTQAFTQNNA